MALNGIEPYIEANYDRFLNELVEWLKIPSISSDPKYKGEVRRSIGYAEKLLKELGFRCQTLETKGHPSLFAERIENSKLPTLLIYGHLDVQPVDPLNQWKNPPFEPWVENNKLYGRGSADDKGQTIIHIHACRYWIEKNGKLPVNVKFIIEGEEEIGSPNFDQVVREHKEKLRADAIVISDTAMVGKGYPTLGYATRGLVYFDLSVTGPKIDLHSGSFGGIVKNPLMVLCQLLSSVVDAKGKIAIPGFYKDVAPLSAQEKKWFSRVEFLNKKLVEVAGVPSVGGERGLPAMQRVWGRPTFEVHGLSGGSIFAPELFKKAFPKTTVLLMGFGLPDENSHAPNEHLDLDNFKHGISTCSRFYELLAKF